MAESKRLGMLVSLEFAEMLDADKERTGVPVAEAFRRAYLERRARQAKEIQDGRKTDVA